MHDSACQPSHRVLFDVSRDCNLRDSACCLYTSYCTSLSTLLQQRRDALCCVNFLKIENAQAWCHCHCLGHLMEVSIASVQQSIRVELGPGLLRRAQRFHQDLCFRFLIDCAELGVPG